jgi:hypothetical protein
MRLPDRSNSCNGKQGEVRMLFNATNCRVEPAER